MGWWSSGRWSPGWSGTSSVGCGGRSLVDTGELHVGGLVVVVGTFRLAGSESKSVVGHLLSLSTLGGAVVSTSHSVSWNWCALKGGDVS